ncbi:hypothetical protein F5B22DRAFT_628393 [Xylaria bambusicola]|uniref:uncharacterized protein n=1 Tax=Xylaria bambusicola TaxID=326684 RepID=UPI0020082AD5|nr:uncharacterized protein F5B22DRAFT_628393 [Xylaria bambusicola]KAI0505256.1 hypothetical protein F5B22DRAFT_628393 [Xylaria bambusicola]
MVSKMDPPLTEKVAFFEQLDACRNFDEESDALSTEEQTLRQESKAFHAAAAAAAAVAKSTKPAESTSHLVKPLRFPTTRLPPSHHRRTASDPAPKPVDKELEIIAVTPVNNRPNLSRIVPATTASSPVRETSINDSIIPETERQPNTRRTRSGIHQTTRVLRSQSNLEPSPSVSMAKRKRSQPLKMAPESKQIFKGLFFFYIPNDDIDPARKMRIKKAQEYGATWTQNSAKATHVIVDERLSYDDIKSTLDDNLTSPSIVLVNAHYPIECCKRAVIIDPNPTVEKYRYGVPGDPGLTNNPTKEPIAPEQPGTQDSNMSLQIKQRRDRKFTAFNSPESSQGGSDLIPSSHPEETRASKPGSKPSKGKAKAAPVVDDLTACIDEVLEDLEKGLDNNDQDGSDSEDDTSQSKKRRLRSSGDNAKPKFRQNAFMCMRGGTRGKKINGPNAETIRLLEEMLGEHQLSNDQWKVQSYQKCISTLRQQSKRIKTAKEARALTNIGSSLAEHIEEIVTTGRFQKLEEIRREPTREALKLFSNVYGVGIPTAMKWVELGYRTVDDLRTKANLSTNQRIGVDHYDDLLTRIPRAEVKALGDHVKDVAATIDPSIELIIGGSHRRGAESSGDIDLIVTKTGTTSTQDLVPFLDKLVDKLTKDGFLTACLASHRHDGGNKWHGCCVLPRTAFPGPKREYNPIWRRIDFLLVPAAEIGAALIYFTGNDLFNRSMRLLARKKNMKLNHRGLFGVGVSEGKDEKKIFEILGVQWREPHERWC